MINLIVYIIIFNALLFQVNANLKLAAPTFKSYSFEFPMGRCKIYLGLLPANESVFRYILSIQRHDMASCAIWYFECDNCSHTTVSTKGPRVDDCYNATLYNGNYSSHNIEFPSILSFYYTNPALIVPLKQYTLRAQALNKWGYGNISSVTYTYEEKKSGAPVFESYFAKWPSGKIRILLQPSREYSGHIIWYFVTVQSKRMSSCILWRYTCKKCNYKNIKLKGNSIAFCANKYSHEIRHNLTRFQYPMVFEVTLPNYIIPGREYIIQAQTMNIWGYGNVASVRYFFHHDCKATTDGYEYRGTENDGDKCLKWSYWNSSKPIFGDLGENFCRNTGDDPAPFCIDKTFAQKHCSIDFCPEECSNGNSYSGRVSMTRNGLECQDWTSQTPHTHGFNHIKGNSCRHHSFNKYPWCYTMDPAVRFDICDIKQCNAECINTMKGTDYQGIQNTTKHGYQCQKWSSSAPHKSQYKTLPGNFCRNPNGYSTPWCYTTDINVYIDICDIKLCTADCFHLLYGTDYNGKWDITISAKFCVKWSNLSSVKYRHLPENYCRNPDGKPKGPWCYINATLEIWEYCGLNMCNDENVCMEKFAFQSNTYELHDAYYAVDGKKSIYNTVSATIYSNPTQWWLVSLEEDYPIRIVLIYNQVENESYLVNSVVELLNIDFHIIFICAYIIKVQSLYTVDCKNNYGYFLRIRNNETKQISLREVECFVQQRSICRKKKAYQSSDYKIYSADLAVDGNYVEDESSITCSRIVNDKEPWWMVDMGSQYLVDVITVYGFEDDISLLNATVELINSDQSITHRCGVISDLRFPFKIPCHYADGRYIKISQLPGNSLIICEVDCSGKIKGF